VHGRRRGVRVDRRPGEPASDWAVKVGAQSGGSRPARGGNRYVARGRAFNSAFPVAALCVPLLGGRAGAGARPAVPGHEGHCLV
jgi:hypothetical protein